MKPRTLTLPSGRRVTISSPRRSTIEASNATTLFADALQALEGDVTIEENGETVDALDLALGDFHVVRAVLLKEGLLEEDEVEIACRNCEAKVTLSPCAGLEIAPWEDGELGDEELDTTLPFGEPVEIPTIPLGRVRSASTVTFEPRTVREARPLFEAFAKDPLVVDAAVVEAMGVVALGNEKEPGKIAEALSACPDDSFGAVTDAFLASHYVLRLGCVAICKECGARNDVDAPYEREMDPVGPRPHAAATEGDEGRAFPSMDTFAERASVIGGPMLEETPGGADIELVVDDGTPAVDDGGEPLLGSYVPPYKGDMGIPARPPTVTLYYRTFRAMWDEEGPYDWEDELRETIEHELEHHVYFLRGDDPMDDEERETIRDEARRIVGKKETTRRAITGFGDSMKDFLARTWPLWVIALIALLAMLATQRN